LENVQIAFCWAHVRRDFLRVRDGYRRLRGWGQSWVERIDELFELNARRLELRSLPEAFAAEDQVLRQAVREMAESRDRELADVELHEAQRKVLESLCTHWKGLVIFVDRPEIPMDNNESERRLRNPIIGRKNYYGSGSVWSGRLSAMLFTLFQTLLLNGIDPKKFLLAYFQACAQHAGHPPQDIIAWLPWNLTAEQKAAWRYPKQQPP
jgi:transposase